MLATAGNAAASDSSWHHHRHHHSCRHVPVQTIIGTNCPDVLVGGRCSDYIYGLGGRDRIFAGGGGDHLFGGRGNDRLNSINGFADVVGGGRGRNDRCRGDQLDIFLRCEHVIRFFIQPVELHQLRR